MRQFVLTHLKFQDANRRIVFFLVLLHKGNAKDISNQKYLATLKYIIII